MVIISEKPWGYEVRAERFCEMFQCRANALLAARIMATAQAVLSQQDVGVMMSSNDGPMVCIETAAAN